MRLLAEQRYYLKHWIIAMGLLLLTAILCAQLQTLYLDSHLAGLVFAFITILGLLFSTLFSWLQRETKNSYLSTWFITGFLSLYQKIVSSDFTFWILFLFPFLFSVLHFYIRSKKLKTKYKSLV